MRIILEAKADKSGLLYMKHHYQTLGLKPGTPWEQIKHSYKDLLKQNHPDKFHFCSNKRKEAEEKTKKINIAFETVAEFNEKVEKKFLKVSSLHQAIKKEHFFIKRFP